ncbi:MAG: type I DNA topoisomerase [Rhodospirillales bacterium]|nr:type I DNA topoisomerase [Rhodospirillales bacterium]
MTQTNLVIVESPAKAKTIEKYLGGNYKVLASFGHIRDLSPRDGSVLPDDDFAMVWQLGERAGKPVSEIQSAVKKADTIWLATDPDREGEAISWHVQEFLNEKNLLKDKIIKRVTFNEITKTAVRKAFEHARTLDLPLIEAYLARRALDYLVGFTLSPVLWRKLPGSKSAGRVQSVALRLICEREAEIEAFRADEYWSIHATLHTPDGAPYQARLTHLAGNKLDKLDIQNQQQAEDAVRRIRQKTLKIQKVEKKQVRRNPSPPFITSTLQQEAARKLYFGAQKTMRCAQKLYEGVSIGGEQTGLITYMRTDGTTLSEEAVQQARLVINNTYGKEYVPSSPRLFKSKAKNAQEAHEAIRPTDLTRTPADVAKVVDEDMAKLYRLIWLRTMASQMEQAVLDQVSADISDGTDDVILRATGSTVAFDGFLKVYDESSDEDKDADEENRRLPPMNEQDSAKIVDVVPEQHFTQPPPRYSEASLVKKLEELGIGRPSTYASILQVLQDRNYVVLDKRRFVPEDRGRVVTAFLMKYFGRYVDYDFTANLEEELDAIAAGHVAWKEALRLFWKDFSTAVDGTKDLTITEVLDHLDQELGAHFFPHEADRKCASCGTGRLGLKLGKFGAFIGCSNYPDCRFTRPLALQDEETAAENNAAASLANEPKILGNDPETGRTVSLRLGPYGPYVQIDPPEEVNKDEKAYEEALKSWEIAKKAAKEAGKRAPAKPKKPAKAKPKRQGLPKGTNPDEFTLEKALKLLAFPRDIGVHPETGKMIQAGIGRFGPYLKHNETFTSLKQDDPLEIGLNRAVVVIAEAAEKKKNAPPRKKPAPKKKTGTSTRTSKK